MGGDTQMSKADRICTIVNTWIDEFVRTQKKELYKSIADNQAVKTVFDEWNTRLTLYGLTITQGYKDILAPDPYSLSSTRVSGGEFKSYESFFVNYIKAGTSLLELGVNLKEKGFPNYNLEMKAEMTSTRISMPYSAIEIDTVYSEKCEEYIDINYNDNNELRERIGYQLTAFVRKCIVTELANHYDKAKQLFQPCAIDWILTALDTRASEISRIVFDGTSDLKSSEVYKAQLCGVPIFRITDYMLAFCMGNTLYIMWHKDTKLLYIAETGAESYEIERALIKRILLKDIYFINKWVINYGEKLNIKDEDSIVVKGNNLRITTDTFMSHTNLSL